MFVHANLRNHSTDFNEILGLCMFDSSLKDRIVLQPIGGAVAEIRGYFSRICMGAMPNFQ